MTGFAIPDDPASRPEILSRLDQADTGLLRHYRERLRALADRTASTERLAAETLQRIQLDNRAILTELARLEADNRSLLS